jgi:hypothetical protein
MEAGLAVPTIVQFAGLNVGEDQSVPPAGVHETINEPPDFVAVKTGLTGAAK